MAAEATPSAPRRRVVDVARRTILVLAVAAVYVLAWRGSDIDFATLFGSLEKGLPRLQAFLTPDLVGYDIEPITVQLPFPVPCGSAPNPEVPTAGPRLVPSIPCADPPDAFIVEGFDLAPNADLQLRWRLPSGDYLPGPFTRTDANGHFQREAEARPIVATRDGVPSQLEVEVLVEVGRPHPSDTVYTVLDYLIVTLFMALIATTLGTIAAAPLSFLAARNITWRGPIGKPAYLAVRTFFNIFRALEPIIIATVFGFWVGYGAFAGMLALSVVTMASLGKLFSEAIENIDPGPVEALTATGANRLQVIVYGVVPQIVPDFLSYIIYHWDINVRISTVIGFVGGGGIGYYLSQMINTGADSKAATAIWAIIIVVWLMDYLSSYVRHKAI